MGYHDSRYTSCEVPKHAAKPLIMYMILTMTLIRVAAYREGVHDPWAFEAVEAASPSLAPS